LAQLEDLQLSDCRHAQFGPAQSLRHQTGSAIFAINVNLHLQLRLP